MQLFDFLLDIYFFYFGEKVDAYDANKRMEACNACEHIKKDFNWGIIEFKGKKQCKICQCDLHKKTKLKFERCPKNKWHK